jgi:hypothetical protein
MMQITAITRRAKWGRADGDIVASSFLIRVIHKESVFSFSMSERVEGLNFIDLRHGLRDAAS